MILGVLAVNVASIRETDLLVVAMVTSMLLMLHSYHFLWLLCPPTLVRLLRVIFPVVQGSPSLSFGLPVNIIYLRHFSLPCKHGQFQKGPRIFGPTIFLGI